MIEKTTTRGNHVNLFTSPSCRKTILCKWEALWCYLHGIMSTIQAPCHYIKHDIYVVNIFLLSCRVHDSCYSTTSILIISFILQYFDILILLSQLHPKYNFVVVFHVCLFLLFLKLFERYHTMSCQYNINIAILWVSQFLSSV